MPAALKAVKSFSNYTLLASVRAFLEPFPQGLVVFPSRTSAAAMNRFWPAWLGFHRRTLPQLSNQLASLRLADLGKSPLSGLAMEAVLTQVVFEVRRGDRLRYFGPVAHLPGFPRALSRTISDLRLARVTPEQLATATDGPQTDLAAVLESYEALLERWSLADFAEILRLAEETARSGSHPLSKLPLALVDVPLPTLAERSFFEALAEQAPAALVAASAWDKRWRERAEDLDSTAPTGELDHLRRHLFGQSEEYRGKSSERLEFFSAPGEGLEAAEIARRILALAREGVSFDDIAILLRNPERYQPTMQEALGRASIPTYFSRGTARPDPSGRALLALLSCAAEKVSASRFAEYLSLGQVPVQPSPAQWVPPADDLQLFLNFDAPAPPGERNIDAPWAWERILVDASVINGAGRWERRLRGWQAEVELQLSAAGDPEERQRLERDLVRVGNLQAFALPLVRRLHSLPSGAAWREWLEHLSELARLALRDPAGVLGVFAELAPMADVGPVTLDQVAAVLTDRLGLLRREPEARPFGAVFVGSVDEARARDFRVVFLPGLAEGIFPQKASEDPLLLDELRRATTEVLRGREDQVAAERERLHAVAGCAHERLIASYPRMDVAAARPRVPSFYALELPRAIQGSFPDIAEFERQAREAAPARLNRPAPHTAGEAIDDAEYDLVAIEHAKQHPGDRARHLMETNPHLARSLRARYTRWTIPAWKEQDGLIATSPAALAAIASQGLQQRAWSPSALERFAVCPYQFALRGILRLEPREDAVSIEQLDPRTRGALFHQVQFELLGELKRAQLLPLHPEHLPEALRRSDAALVKVAEEYSERLCPAVPRVWQTEIEDLRTDLRGWLQHAARDDQEWEPIRFELGFGLRAQSGRDAASIVAEVALPGGTRLRGSIDLVERNTVRGVLRVTDHKTGRPPERIPHWTGGGRHLQPLLYSLAAEQLLGTPVDGGRLFYCTQRGRYQQMQVNLTPQARGAMQQFLDHVDRFITGGFLPPYPEKDACKICDYRTACGPYEEERTARKNRDDERLEPLIQIRGMA